MDALQIDLATVVLRLRQIDDEGIDNSPLLIERLITCDLPRLEKHLTTETLNQINEYA